jgi:hypothetical protein
MTTALHSYTTSRDVTDDGVAVIQLLPGFDWATFKTNPAGAAWLKRVSP